jgi:hypothetical protein
VGDPIRVDVAGLSALAARCEQHATAVSGNSAELKVAAGGFPATTAAVHAVSESVVVAGQRMSGRLSSPATASTGAAADYRSTELNSTARIAAVTPSSNTTILV